MVTLQKRKLLSSKNDFVVAPGIYDALGARLAEKEGFRAVYMSGFSVTASMIAKPDIGLLTMSEMVRQAINIVNAVNIPVIADADTGYGGLANIERTVVEYERAGVSAIHLEDQVSPKRCGHMSGVKVIEKEDMLKNIKCALASRSSSEFLIIARTDAFKCVGMEEAVKRGKYYADAGADIVFVDGLSEPSDYERVSGAISAPKMATIVEVNRPPKVNAKVLKEMGFSIVLFPVSALFTVTESLSKVMREIIKTGTTEGLYNGMIDYASFNELMGIKRFDGMQDKFAKDIPRERG